MKQHANKYAIDMQTVIDKQERRIEQLEREKAELVSDFVQFLEDMHIMPVEWTCERSAELHAKYKPAGRPVLGATETEGVEG